MNEQIDRIADIFKHRCDSKDAQERCADAVGPLLNAVRYCKDNVIDNLPSIARKTFTEKLGNILQDAL